MGKFSMCIINNSVKITYKIKAILAVSAEHV